tara:strand:+ start:2444 stop:3697 length:1254 start_codon:yes stop_codon:yes gene_type:complete
MAQLMQHFSKKLNILSLQYYCYPDEVGGAWKYTHEVNRRLVERGHRVYLITCKPSDDFSDEEEIDGVIWKRIGMTESKNLISLSREARRRYWEVLRSGPIDLIHVHNPLVEFSCFLNRSFRSALKIYHFHSLWHDEERIIRLGRKGFLGLKDRIIAEAIRLVELFCFWDATKVLFLSRYSKRRFEAFYPLRHPSLEVIPGGVDTEAYCPSASGLGPKQLRERLGLPVDIPVFLTVRRLAARMGLDRLISACAILRKRNPDRKFCMVIVGKGEWHDRLCRQIRELGLEDYVLMVGKVTGEKIHFYYETADLFILPTLSIEGFGLATVEALASGLPVLGTPVGGTIEILGAINDKLLLNGTEPKDLADGMGDFLKNPEFYSALREKCRKEAEEKYNWEQIVDKLEKSFFTAVSRNRSNC